MAIYLTDTEIKALLDEQKLFPVTIEDFFRFNKTKKGHYESEQKIERPDGSFFIIKLRQNIENVLDFTSLLAYANNTSSDVFILCRYNGKSHEHRNKLDKTPVFYDFHIHKATQLYQDNGFKEEFYATVTDRYSDLKNAFLSMVEDCSIILPKSPSKSQSEFEFE